MSQPSPAEEMLLLHPGVDDVAVLQNNGAAFKVFAVPNGQYAEQTAAGAGIESKLIAKWRKIFDLTQFTKTAVAAPVGFNVSGWNSSYTRQPIPDDQMRDWLEASVADIVQLRPKRVCEIGCGTGMLLLRIAPACERYVALDFSSAVLDKVREQLRKQPAAAARVNLLERTADDLTGLEGQSFDTVVINSVVQYFPDSAYLTRVLESAVTKVADGGRILVGDVLSLPLLPLLASSVVFFQATDNASVEQLRQRIHLRNETFPELILSPTYFLSLQKRIPRISMIEIRPRLDRCETEMSKYRYQAILHVGAPKAAIKVEFGDWNECEYGLHEMSSYLQDRGRDCLGVKNIKNARLTNDILMLEDLRTQGATRTAGDLRRDAAGQGQRGLYPWEIAELGARLDYDVFLSWRACRADGSFDALFVPKEHFHAASAPAINWPEPDPSEFVRLATAPGQGKLHAELVGQLMAHCRQNLSQEPMPGDIFLVDTIVRKGDGTVDFDALQTAAARPAF